MYRFIPAAFLVLTIPLTAGAALDPQKDVPYQLTVVLHVQEHPLLTPAFTDGLAKELRDALQRDLAKMCNVDLVREHPLMKEVNSKGWVALDRAHAVDDRKLHFIRVEYADGQYELQARQVDGSTGLVGPLRRARTPDRLWVARQAALTITGDFGVVGTITETTRQTIKVRLKGGGFTDAMAGRVQQGEVFAIAHIRQGAEGEPPQSVRVPYALLQVLEVRDSECTTKLLHRYENPLQIEPRTLGFRVMKLETRHGPLQLRVVDAKTGEPVRGCAVKINLSQSDATDLGATDAQGLVRSKESFRNVVVVELSWQGKPLAAPPIALVDDQPVEVRLTITEESEHLVEFERVYRQWRQKLREASGMLEREVRTLNDLEKEGQREAAAKKAGDLAQKLQDEVGGLRKGLDDLRTAGRKAGPEAIGLLDDAERSMATLNNHIKSLQDYAQSQQNPVLQRARLMEESAEAEEAIKLYEQTLKDNPNQPNVAARLDKLKKAWEIKSGDHAEARKFIYETWGKLSWEEIEKRLPEAEMSLAACESAGDFLTVRKLAKVNAEHLSRLDGALGQLSPMTSADDQQKAQQIKKAAEAIGGLNKKVGAYLDRAAN